MSDTVIRVENFGKHYVLGKSLKPASTSLGRIKQSVGGTFDWLMQQVRGPNPEQILWALREVSFEMKEGEAVGIIGRNGAGKSTLLKLLSRITEPTEGFAEIKGRIGALLEVGTGMHTELTGRENIYMNATLLGMTRREVDRRFDEIVDFSGIERFIDTPVKRYSSGMRVRLGFAIAAHLEPEILIVDEVLAVGDSEFQKKSIGKMEEVGKKGRTVLFVSHNIPLIASLCHRGILLDGGRIVSDDEFGHVAELYCGSESVFTGSHDFTREENILPGDDVAKLLRARIVNEQGQIVTAVETDRPVTIEMEYRVTKKNQDLTPNLHVYNTADVCVFVAICPLSVSKPNQMKGPGDYIARCTIPAHFLNDITYKIGFALTTVNTVTVHFFKKDLLSLQVSDPIGEVVTRANYKAVMPGTVRPLLTWESEKLS